VRLRESRAARYHECRKCLDTEGLIRGGRRAKMTGIGRRSGSGSDLRRFDRREIPFGTYTTLGGMKDRKRTTRKRQLTLDATDAIRSGRGESSGPVRVTRHFAGEDQTKIRPADLANRPSAARTIRTKPRRRTRRRSTTEDAGQARRAVANHAPARREAPTSRNRTRRRGESRGGGSNDHGDCPTENGSNTTTKTITQQGAAPDSRGGLMRARG
jgi:hypothetical protein